MRFLVTYFLSLTFILTSDVVARPTVTLESASASMTIDLGGGSISSFSLKGGLNPLAWDSYAMAPPETRGSADLPRSMGHFLCLDRWGSASEAEKKNGITNHGEATTVWWSETRRASSEEEWTVAELSAALPIAGLSVTRDVRLLNDVPVAVVNEAVTNENLIGRIYNSVQHPSIGGPFLDEETVVDTNATRGFMQNRPMPAPESPEVQWPHALTIDGEEVDIRFLQGDHEPGVVSYIVEDDLGWITAASPNSRLLIGYLWQSDTMPWVNLWRNARKGRPYARGLEFGTSGLHRPGHDLVAKGTIFDRPLYRYIDASETQTYAYAMFLLEIPEDFRGVSRLNYEGGEIRILESDATGRKYVIEAGELF